MKVTVLLRDSVGHEFSEITAEEAAEITSRISEALARNPMGIASVAYPNGAAVMIPAQHILIVRVQP